MSRKRENEPNLPSPEPKRISKGSAKAKSSDEQMDKMSKTLKLWDSRLREIWIEALGVSPQILLDELINAANEQMYIMLSKIEMFVSKFIPEESIVEEKMTEIDVLLEASVDKHFDIFETLVKEKVFHFTSDEPVVPFHYESLLSDNQDHEIEALINELKEEDKKLKQAEMVSSRVKQIQSKYNNALNEYQDAIDKLKLIDTKINENDAIFLRGNLVYFLDEFRRIFEVYANAADVFKKPPSIQYTHQDLYVQQSTLSTLKDMLRFIRATPFTALNMPADMKKVKSKPWTALSQPMIF